MSNNVSEKTKQPATEHALTPKLRFPEFENAGEWEEKPLNQLAKPVSEKASDKESHHILTLSGEYGLVLQSDYFGKKIAGDNVDRYIRIVANDFVYNDRTTKLSIYGSIKRLSKYESGIVSPIYKCFRFEAGENPVFWDWYFESGFHEKQLQGLVNEGARAGRYNISIDKFLSTLVWHPGLPEQQKIADCLSSLDELITAEAQKLDTLRDYKKGLMQQLFPAAGETLPKRRFPEFRDAGEWEEKQLFQLTTKISDGIHGTPIYDENGEFAFINGNNLINNRIVIDEKTKRVGLAEFNKHKKAINANSILMSINGTIGNLAFFRNEKIVLGKSAYFINVDVGLANKFFVYTILQTDKVKAAFDTELTGSTIKNLSLGAIKNLRLAVPALLEQQKIAECISSLDELIEAQTQKLELLKLHKKGLMQQLFPALDEVNA